MNITIKENQLIVNSDNKQQIATVKYCIMENDHLFEPPNQMFAEGQPEYIRLYNSVEDAQDEIKYILSLFWNVEEAEKSDIPVYTVKQCILFLL